MNRTTQEIKLKLKRDRNSFVLKRKLHLLKQWKQCSIIK